MTRPNPTLPAHRALRIRPWWMNGLFAVALGTTLGTSLGCPKAAPDVKVVPNGEARVLRVELTGGSFDVLNLDVVVRVKNTGSIPLPLDGGDVTLTALGPAKGDGGGVTATGTGTLAAPVTIAAGESEDVRMTATLPVPQDADAFETFFSWSQAKMLVKGDVSADGTRVSFERERLFGLPELPQVRVDLAQVSSQDSGASGEVYFEVTIVNPNMFELDLASFNWGFSVDGVELRQSGEGAAESIPPSAEGRYSDSAMIDATTFGNQVRTVLRQPAIPYTLSGTWTLRNLKRDFTFSGEMSLPR